MELILSLFHSCFVLVSTTALFCHRLFFDFTLFLSNQQVHQVSAFSITHSDWMLLSEHSTIL